MAEIKKDLIPLVEGEAYTPGAGEFVVTDDHSIADVVRFAVSCSDKEDVEFILDNMTDDA